MKLGFVILSFKEPDRLFEKLLENIRKIPGAEISLHHDYSQSGLSEQFISQFGVHTTPTSYVTKWSHINNVLATIDAVEVLYRLPVPPDWYITVTPNCYPVKSAEYISNFFKKSAYNAYVQMRRISLDQPEFSIDRYIVRDLKKRKFTMPFVNKKLGIGRKELFFSRTSEKVPFEDKGYELWHGSNWLALDKTVVKRMIDADLKNHPTTLYYLKNYRQDKDMHPCPQEIIIPSFIGNLKGLSICNNYFRYIDWNEHKNWHPNLLTEKDFEKISASDALWARKFEYPHSKKLIELIDENLL